MEKEDKARLDDMRRRFLEVGVEALSPQETLELLFSYASTRTDSAALSRGLLLQYGSMQNLFSASLEMLKNGGLEESLSVFVTLVGQVGRQIFLEGMESKPDAFTENANIGRYFLELVRGQPHDSVYELCLNGGAFLSCAPLADGDALLEDTDIRREIIRRIAENALTSAANGVALCRHVSGGLLVPSVTDRILIERVRAALDTLRVNFRDYVLVTDNDFVSMSETGLMERPWEIGQ